MRHCFEGREGERESVCGREFGGRVLTIAILVLQHDVVSCMFVIAQAPGLPGSRAAWQRMGRALTNREKASLNSETCSSVRESAYMDLLAMRSGAGGQAIVVFCRAGYVWECARTARGYTP